MRTNLVDGVIIGLGISLVVLVARWFFRENQVLEQAATIIIGGVVLALIQLWIDRRRAHTSPPAQPIANEPAPPPPTTPLTTPRTPWATSADPAAPTEPLITDLPAESAPDVPPSLPATTEPTPAPLPPDQPK